MPPENSTQTCIASHIDQIYRDFERAWLDDASPRLEDFLGQAPPEARTELFRRLLTLELSQRAERGETTAWAEYERRFPIYFDAVRAFFQEQPANGPQLPTLAVDLNSGDFTMPGKDAKTNQPSASRPRENGLPGPLPSMSTVSQGPPRTTSPAVAATLGRIRDYELLEKLGEGGMGAVYKALHAKLKRPVAIKILPREKLLDQQAVARFNREMEAVGQLVHPNIVLAHDAGEADGQHYLVMELIEGIDLTQLVARIGPLPVADACELVRQAATGLAHAHRFGLVHRDIKPSNLILTCTGQTKLLDQQFPLSAAGGADCRPIALHARGSGAVLR